MKTKNTTKQSRHVVEHRIETMSTKAKILRISAVAAAFTFAVAVPGNKVFAEDNVTITCKYRDPNAFVMTCEEEKTEPAPAAETAPAPAQTPVAQEQPVVETTAPEVAPVVQEPEEEIAVPIVGDIENNTVEDEEIGPLGETYSGVNYDNLVAYEYGTLSDFTLAGLDGDESSLSAFDIALIVLVCASMVGITACSTVFVGRMIKNRPAHHNLAAKAKK